MSDWETPGHIPAPQRHRPGVTTIVSHDSVRLCETNGSSEAWIESDELYEVEQ